jgi:hypothetical protein
MNKKDREEVKVVIGSWNPNFPRYTVSLPIKLVGRRNL